MIRQAVDQYLAERAGRGLTPNITRRSLRGVVNRTKRTYNLSPATVRRVREMAEEYRVAPSQDAVIELAVDELARSIRDQREADEWERAASDPEFAGEANELQAAYRSADRETWPA